MEDPEDKLFNGYFRCNMAKIATEVKVREIMPHLPSLTQSDQENIDAKRENTGNYNAIQLLLSRLRCRHGWLEEFIAALQSCKHSALATQIRQEYESLKTQPRPSSAEASPQSLPEPATCTESHSTDDIRAVPSTIVARPSTDFNGAMLSSAPCCVEGASINDEIFSNKPVLLTSTHSVQVHRPFDSPTASPSVVDEGAFSMNFVNQEYGSNSAVNSSERVETESTSLKHAENVAVVDAKKVAAGDAENVAHGDSEWVDPGNANKKPIRDVEVEVLNDLTKGALYNEDMVAVNDVDGVIRNDAQIVAPGKAEQIVPGRSECPAFNDASRTVFEEVENVALHDAEKIAGDKVGSEAPGDDNRVVPGDVETEALGEQEIVAPDDGGSEGLGDAEKVSPCSVKTEALCEVDRAASGNVASEDPSGTVALVKVESDALIDTQRAQLDHPESAAFSEKEAVTPHDAEGVLSHDISSGSGEIKGSPGKNTTVSSNEGDTTPGKVDSIAPTNQENLVHDKEEKVERSSLEGPELHDPSDHNVTSSCHSLESVILDRGGPRKVQNKAADITETDSPCSTESTAQLGLEASDHSYPNPIQNVAKENDSDIVSQTNPPDAPDLMAASLFLGKASSGVSGVSGEGDSVALLERDDRKQDKSESGNHCNGDREANAEGHSKASSEEDNGTPGSEAADDEENRALGLTAGGASVGAYSRPLGDKDGGAPEDGGFMPPGDTDSEVSGNGNGASHGEGDSSATAERESRSSENEGSQTAGEYGSCQTQNEGNGVSADVNSDAQEKDDSMVPDKEPIWGPIKGNNMITVEEGSREPEFDNTRRLGEGDSGEPAEGSCDIPRVRDCGTPDEVGIVAPSFTELPQNNLETHHPSSLSDHIPENITPNDQDSTTYNEVQSTTTSEEENVVHSYTASTQKEQEEDQNCSPYLEIRSASSALPNYSPEAVSPEGTEGVTPGISELHHPQTKENHCGTIHHENGLISAEAFTPGIDSAPSLNTDSRGPLNSSPANNEPSQNRSSSTHLTNDSAPPSSLKHEPGSAAYIHMKSHAHETTQNPSDAPVHEATDEQDVKKKRLYDLAVQNHTAASKAHVSVVTEANQELSMQNNSNPLGNHYVTAAVAGVIAAAVLWQIRK